VDTLSAFAVKVLFRLISWLPVRVAGGIGAGLGRIGYYLDRRHRDVARRNLARIYPQRGRRWRAHIARESFAELGRTTFEMPHVFLRSRAFLQSRVEIDGENEFRAALAQGKGAFIAAYHYSNWEMCGVMFSALASDTNCIYRALEQSSLEHFVKQRRERFGASMRPRQKGLRWLPRELKQGRPVYILLDQHLSNGIPMPFLGHMANTTTLPAAFALKGTPVFSISFRRAGRDFRFRMQLHPIDIPPPSGDKDADAVEIMRRINRPLEDTIRERPELWLWAHRRWRILEQEPQIAEVVYGAP